MPHSTERQLVALILMLAAALGLARLLIVPAWANADEPAHFEVILNLAEHRELSSLSTPDIELRERVMDSTVVVHPSWGIVGQMANGRIDAELGLEDDEDWAALGDELQARPGSQPREPSSIGPAQFDEPPGFYLFQALLQVPFQNSRIETRLAVARFGSVILGVLAVWLVYAATGELFPHEPLVRVAVPALVALLPSFTATMSATNDDIAAVAALSLLIFAAVRLIRRGPSVSRLLLLLIGTAVCVIAKTTAWVGLPLAVLALPLARRTPWPAWAFWAVVLAMVVGVAAAIEWRWPAGWYPVPSYASVRTQPPHGQRTIRVDAGSGGLLWQTLPAPTVEQLRGQRATVGAWVRAPAGSALATLPSVWWSPPDASAEMLPGSGMEIMAGENWEFHAAAVTVPDDVQCLSVRLASQGAEEQPDTAIEYDGVVLAVGEWPSGEPPDFQGRFATRGFWGGRPFKNLAINGSGERGQPQLRPQLERLVSLRIATSGSDTNHRVASLLDWKANGPTFSQMFRWVFTTFWSWFGWYTPGLPRAFVWLLAILCGAAGAGLLLVAIRTFPALPLWQQRALYLYGAACLAVLGLAVLRLDPIGLGECDRYQGRFLPVGRYILPAVSPLLTLWFLGLRAWLPQRWHRWLVVGCIAGLFVLNVGSLVERQIPYFLAAYGLPSHPTIWSIPLDWYPH